jgi:hypothetical protein
MAPNPNISAAIAPANIATMKTNVEANKAFIDPFGVKSYAYAAQGYKQDRS